MIIETHDMVRQAFWRRLCSTNGGNQDGVINSQDSVFASPRLWQDVNHNGSSEDYELHSLPELGVEALELRYKESRRADQ
ncbi:MAG: hypothetical protein H0T77_11740 [Pyrinomonadaceae bacterium]|nr:hypothetical protein [Pyrinomonadaceae bacterium]